MKTLTILILLSLLTLGYAGPGKGHSHSQSKKHSHKKKHVSKEETLKIAKLNIVRLIRKGKLDKSWENTVCENPERKRFGKKVEWALICHNEKGVKGKKLYIFLSLSGEFIAGNFTGK